ncbi:hypothetical protein BZG36_01117 [Bifiguratus adelaidae]|uniref:Transcription elongation factor n=1 Tax=Bifiguratus adelaidae TaxID=1938954 RepID=A0A261Y660_9FUNG|nr:hypothetical protein BZG36_01117 [Bifiguratus adelaidae]
MADAEVGKLVKALNRSREQGQARDTLDILTQLQKVHASEDLLRKTGIGKIVGKLRTDADLTVAKKAKDVVDKWKKDCQSALKSNGIPKTPTEPKLPMKVDATSTTSSQSPTDSSPKTPPDTPRERSIKTDDITVKPTGNVARDKSIELFYAALGYGSFVDSDLLLQRATKIENAIFEEFQTIDAGYKTKVRSLSLNLKAKNNPGLRESVVTGELLISKLVKMSKEDMASEEQRAADRKAQEQAIFAARGATTAQAETDMFRCGKCKSRKCTYYQMQTRSADEPMTTFVTCTNCENRWKFC